MRIDTMVLPSTALELVMSVADRDGASLSPGAIELVIADLGDLDRLYRRACGARDEIIVAHGHWLVATADGPTAVYVERLHEIVIGWIYRYETSRRAVLSAPHAAALRMVDWGDLGAITVSDGEIRFFTACVGDAALRDAVARIDEIWETLDASDAEYTAALCDLRADLIDHMEHQ